MPTGNNSPLFLRRRFRTTGAFPSASPAVSRLAQPTRPGESEAVTSGKVATHRMEKQSVAISAVFGIFTDLGQSELPEKPL
jgi:hypothetical protein